MYIKILKPHQFEHKIVKTNIKNFNIYFKALSGQLVNKKIDETFLKDSTNVRMILNYLLANANVQDVLNKLSILEDMPLLLKQNMVLAKFSSSTKVYVYEDPCIFNGQDHQFVHKDLYNTLANKKCSFLHTIQIEDLANLLPSLLDSDLYITNDLFISHDKTKTQIYLKIWKIISECFKSNEKPNFDSIKNWALVPVCHQDREPCLAPIKKCTSILNQIQNDFMWELLKPVDFLVFDSLFSTNAKSLFESSVMDLSKNEDLLMFLEAQKDTYKQLFEHNPTKCQQLFKHLANCVKRRANDTLYFQFTTNNAIEDRRAKDILRNLPIYEDVFGRFEILSDQEAYFINMENVPRIIKDAIFHFNGALDISSARYEDFISFSNDQNIIIINQRENLGILFL